MSVDVSEDEDAFVYSLPDMELIKTFEYTTETNEGWGAAYNAATRSCVVNCSTRAALFLAWSSWSE